MTGGCTSTPSVCPRRTNRSSPLTVLLGTTFWLTPGCHGRSKLFVNYMYVPRAKICFINMKVKKCLYLLTAWSRVLLEKLTGFAANQEIPRILWNSQVHHRTHKRPPTVPILSQPHPVLTTPSHFLKILLNIILQSTSWSPQWSLSLRFPHQNLVHTSPFLPTCHTPSVNKLISYMKRKQ